jgi:hypothetical protein
MCRSFHRWWERVHSLATAHEARRGADRDEASCCACRISPGSRDMDDAMLHTAVPGCAEGLRRTQADPSIRLETFDPPPEYDEP